MGRNETTTHKENNSPGDTYNGVLDITRSGMGYVVVENLDVDILIRPNEFNTAMHGDKVRVRVLSESGKSGRKQGQVLEVLERKQTEFIGRIELNNNNAFFIGETDKSMPDFYIAAEHLNGAVDKDKVLVKLVEWKKNRKPVGSVIQVM